MRHESASRRELQGRLTVTRSFVIHVEEGARPSAGRVAGRVEHVASGAVADFRSAAELWSFLDRYCEAPPRRRGRARKGASS